jgi:hypothetical protein
VPQVVDDYLRHGQVIFNNKNACVHANESKDALPPASLAKASGNGLSGFFRRLS